MFESQFTYVDFHAHDPKLGTRLKWRRILETHIPEHLEKYKDWDCFVSVQKYADPVHQIGQIQYAPLYFDLDSPDPEESRKDALKIVSYFDAIGVPQTAVRVFFSGKKGFHITVEPDAIGIEPHPELSYQIKNLAVDLAHQLSLKTFDDKVYSIRRAWRIPNSRHSGSGCYCVELTLSELMAGMELINRLSVTPREEEVWSQTEHVAFDKEYWKQWQKTHNEIKVFEQLQPKGDIKPLSDGSDPACYVDLYNNGLRKQGSRHMAVRNMLTWLWKKGVSKEEAIAQITEWSLKQGYPFTNSTPEEKSANVKSVANAIWAKKHEEWKFSCASMRSVGGPDDACLACDWEHCKFVKQEDQKPEKRVQINLNDCIEPEFKGIPVQSKVYVMGVTKNPFMVPKKIMMSCKPRLDAENSICHGCMHADRGEAELKIDSQSRLIVAMCNVSDGEKMSLIKRQMQIPERCHRNTISEIGGDYAVGIALGQPTSDDPADDRKTRAHLVHTIYVIGNKADPSVKYNMNLVTHTHPKNQSVIHIADRSEPLKSNFESFTMTTDIFERLKIFNVMAGQTVEKKIEEIHVDLTHNVHQNWGRDFLGRIVDLVFHSALSFYFDNKFIKRGWLELAVFGDSGTAKSNIATQLMNFYQRGERVGCEQASEAGIIGGCDTEQGIISWGVLPRNDMGLVILDEAHSFKDNVIDNMSEVRDMGEAKITKINKGEVPARCRKIFIANPKIEGQNMDNVDYGLTVLTSIFKKSEDVRRLDLAMAIKNADVSNEEIHKRKRAKVDHVYDQGSCILLLDWIWSRKPEQIKFDSGCEDYIMERAIKLSSKYDPSIPLITGAVMRFKIARLAVAIAGRLFSCDGTGELLVVKKEHVDYACKLFDDLYDSDQMGYGAYSRMARQFREWDEKEFELCVNQFKFNIPNWQSLFECIKSLHVFRLGDLYLAWGETDKMVIKTVIDMLRRFKLIKSQNSSMFCKTEKFMKLYKALAGSNESLPEATESEFKML